MLPKKVSWILLTLYFIFDSVVSYVAVTRMGGRELNSVIAPFVENYPLLYFLCIPLELIGAYFIVLLLRRWFDEKIILTSAAIYWPIANSSMNLLFLLGFRHMGYLWGPLTVVGLIASLGYLFTILRER
ncbi:hypothetical protein A2363_02195 [Candidatus Gottesmanbacteria bacterium RIFOXYB1_FULL_47_11]|uniref:DUF5658 domain-containing protein n=1 Tax=Candidatus Gottesmanbacteria bacterium RIFOXYB1_FULL_47_11 TaxID=1798401 RepID=A0A1F6BE98_9BACT|nr:MAG: hypothetical protein A2363_02195 [Candidatus Gottesmanbacteria bacterium RIFOXYB1_FULL_47_11]